MSSNGGRFAVSRDVFDHPVFKKEPFTECQAWIWIIGQAGWKPRRTRATSGRSVEMVDLNRGQFCLALRFIRDALHWPSEKRVRTFLNRLEREGMIAVRRDALQNIVTVCNYDAYQFATSETDAQNDAQSDAQETRIGRKLKNENKSKNVKKSKEVHTLGFDEWYAVYPRKKQPDAALRAYAKVRAAGTITEAELLERTNAFAASWKLRPADDHRFIPYPASWLNKAGFADELDRPPVAAPTRGGLCKPINAETAARRERFRLPPARPGSVGDALELLGCELQEREQADRASAARVVGSSGRTVAAAGPDHEFGSSWVAQALPGVDLSQLGAPGPTDTPRSTSAAFDRLRERMEQGQPSDDVFGVTQRLRPLR